MEESDKDIRILILQQVNERVTNITHAKQALIRHFLMYNIDDSQELELIFLNLRAQLVQGEDNPLQLVLADGVLEYANFVYFLQQVQAAGGVEIALFCATVAGLVDGYMNRHR